MPIERPKPPPKRNSPGEIVRERIAEISETRLENHLKHIVGVRHHESAPGALEAAADYITDQFQAAGLSVNPDPFEGLGHPNRNIVAMGPARTGNDTGSALLILGAHYDTVAQSPGADDNASGVAVMLEAARCISELSQPGRWTFIAFAQEEQDCLGSTRYAVKARRSAVPLQGMIALECVGYASPKPGSQQSPPGLPIPIPDVGNFLGVVSNPDAFGLKQQFETAINRYVPELPVVGLVVPDAGRGFPDTRRSDHAPFWDAGFPAMMLTDTANFRNPWYHQPGDRVETLDLPFMIKVTKAVVAFLTETVLREEK